MTNRYEAPEVVEIGKAQDAILGEKYGMEHDSQTGEYNMDWIISDLDE